MTTQLFTVATQPTSGLERLQTSLTKFSVPITILGQGEEHYWGHGWRWKTFIRAVAASSADTVIHCDGYDSVCLASISGVVSRFQALAHPMVFSYEPQAQPEPWLGLNPGLVMADRQALLSAFGERTLVELFPDHFNDMFQIQSMYSWDPAAFLVDRQGVLFHTVGPRSPELEVRNGQLTNPDTSNSPAFVHAPRNGDLSKVEQWVASQ